MLAKLLKQREEVLAFFTLAVWLTIGMLVYTQKLKPTIGCITGAVVLFVGVCMHVKLVKSTV